MHAWQACRAISKSSGLKCNLSGFNATQISGLTCQCWYSLQFLSHSNGVILLTSYVTIMWNEEKTKNCAQSFVCSPVLYRNACNKLFAISFSMHCLVFFNLLFLFTSHLNFFNQNICFLNMLVSIFPFGLTCVKMVRPHVTFSVHNSDSLDWIS